jgi:hypothetical protein
MPISGKNNLYSIAMWSPGDGIPTDESSSHEEIINVIHFGYFYENL